MPRRSVAARERLDECADRGEILVAEYQNSDSIVGSAVCDTNEDGVTDILADLMHYCQRAEIDFDNQLRIARGHYNCERSGIA
jgi:hypothetical protein